MLNNPNLNKYEQEHFDMVLSMASECCLFLKRNNEDFPLLRGSVDKIGLYGNGIRKTIKGGTGSGNVDVHSFKNVEQVFRENGIKVTSSEWLDQYDKDYDIQKLAFVDKIKKEAADLKISAASYSVGFVLPEWERDYLKYLHGDDVSLYVLARNSGEGHDRENKKGSYLLTQSEIDEITYLSKHSKKFLLVINAAFSIDLSPIIDIVDNILLLNFLGSATSETLYKIVFGESYPSGKLSSTWDKLENYPSFNNFGDINETQYKEGIYVGYRYFSTYEKKPLFPFGFGLSYTDFKLSFKDIKNEKSSVKVRLNCKNIGKFNGKEVAQLYLSKPSNSSFDNPKYELVSYVKSKELKPDENEVLELSFDLSDFACFDSTRNIYFLPHGIYVLSIGNSSINLEEIATLEIEEEIVLKQVKHVDEYKDFAEELKGKEFKYKKLANNINLGRKDFEFVEVKYEPYKVEINEKVNSLSIDQMIRLSIGNIRGGLLGMIGDSCISLVGGAGETCLTIPDINHLVMVDGPAGVRVCKECINSKGKKFKISTDPIWAELTYYLPKVFSKMMDNKKNAKKKGEKYYQYSTALPVASSLSCSFDDEILYRCGEIIKKEMECFGADIWLAPAINIVRDPRCGRNFEYYSEDPYLTYRCASNITRGVQDNSNRKVCIKHYACNNQETNRTHNNSILSIRALREIYIKSFEKTIENASPFAVMTSYNLVNDTHASESSFLVNDVLRNEFNFKGLVMTDWISSGDKADPRSLNASQYASNNIKAGVNLCMPGKKSDIKDIQIALKTGKLTIDDLKQNCSIILNNL